VLGAPPYARADEPPRYESRVTADSEADRARQSAEAVTTYDTGEARRQSADLGTVLGRIEGVSVARNGGLGTEARLSLNGFSGEQVRVFVDGVPLELAGFSFGVTSVPVTLVDRIEVYRGVVPLRFGADALGGALNLVTASRHLGTGASGSLEVGSFSTYRGAVSAHHRDRGTGSFGAITAYFDGTRNDYDVAVEVPDDTGRLHEAIVPRFHDGYAARGLVLDLGVVDKPWLRHLVLRAFYSEYDKELQHNTDMTVPYGAVRYGESVLGATLSLAQPDALGHGVDLDALLSFTRRTTTFVDRSSDVYDWFGNVIRQRPQPGEIDGIPHQASLFRDALLARLGVVYRPEVGHALRVGTTASYDASHGVSSAGLVPGAPDPLAAPRALFKLVSGVEYQLDTIGDRLENVFFAKHYYAHADARAVSSGAALVPVQLDDQAVGAGNNLRVRLYRRALWAKAAYEYATRLPSATEVFGDGILVVPNPSLRPERSHNANLGLGLELARTRAGAFFADLRGVLRQADNLIQLLAQASSFSYQNVLEARTLGLEGSTRFISPREWVALELAGTWQDIRNLSTTGPFADYRGDRLPNMPWLFLHASLRVQYRGLLRRDDRLALTWFTRYVHAFYRDWESLGAPEYKPVIDEQVAHALNLTYVLRTPLDLTLSFDVDNLTDARLYDVYGVQRPGRAFYGKVSFSL
jgi:outer membrane cobalamin receptor